METISPRCQRSCQTCNRRGPNRASGSVDVLGVWLVIISEGMLAHVPDSCSTKRRPLSYSSTHKPERTTSPTDSSTNNHAYMRMPGLVHNNGGKDPHATRDECSRDNSSNYFVFCLVIHRAILPRGVSGYLKNVHQA